MLSHRARDHVDTRFYSAQYIAAAVGLHEQRRVEAGNERAGAGRVTGEAGMFQASAGPVLHLSRLK